VINAAEIVDNLVELLRDIPELLDKLKGDPQNIYAYHDRYPKNVSLDTARYKMVSPAIMVAYTGTGPGSRGDFEAWRHELSLTLRAGEEDENQSPAGYYALFRLIVKGVPTSSGQPLCVTTVHEFCDPMDTPTMRRQTDMNGVDYFEIAMTFTEIGDD
jgi:hypothetical protein